MPEALVQGPSNIRWSQFARDARIAVRGFRRTPTFVISVLAILGLGIGAVVATFTVFRAVLLERLPVREPQRLVVLTTFRDPSVEFGLQLRDLSQIAAASRTLQGIAGYVHWGAAPVPMLDGDRALTLNRVLVSGGFFDVLGCTPFAGRLLRPSDSYPGATQVIVLSYNTWLRTFGGDPNIVGRALIDPYSRSSYTVVGVAPPGLDYPARTEMWLPEPVAGGSQSIIAVARLAAGATGEAARTELFAIMQQIKPEARLAGTRSEDYTRAVLGDVTPFLSILTTAVALLLLIACVNVGNLLLLRSASRTQEIAVRRALGATYADVLQQILVESGLLAVAGGVLGLACAEGLVRLLVAYAPNQLPRIDVVGLAGAPITASIVATTLAMLIFGVVPALVAARSNTAMTLRPDARSGGDSVRRRRIRQMLVATQTMLALVLLTGGALLWRSLERLQNINLGFDSERLSVLFVAWDQAKIEAGPKLFPEGEEVAQRWRAIPGVTAVTPILTQPLYGENIFLARVDREGQSPSEAEANAFVPYEVGGKEFFRTFRIAIVRGREFLETDREGAMPVVVVSEKLARRMWPGEDPIGKRVRFGTTEWRSVVGVAADTHLRTLRSATGEVFVPWRQMNFWQNVFAIRTTGSLTEALPRLRRELRAADPRLTLWMAAPMQELLDVPLSQPRMLTMLMSAFGIAALLLSALGLYGMTASSVRERTREFGIRMSLGATPARVRRQVLQQALVTCGFGAVAGIGGALACSRLLASQLYEVRPADPLALLSACVVLLAVALIAAYVPARRATRIDPAHALRAD